MDRFTITVLHSESDTVWQIFDNTPDTDGDMRLVEEYTLGRGYTYEYVRGVAFGMNRVIEWLQV